MIIIDRLSYNSKLRYENAGEKFAFAVITLLISVISRSTAVACIVLAVTGILIILKGGVPVFRYVKFIFIPLAFLFLSTITIIFQIQYKPLDLFSIKIGSVYITSSKALCVYAINLILTSLSAVSCLYFLSFTTPMIDILDVLKKLRCPKLLVELMLLIYRFIFILLDTASAISTAQNCRLGNKDYKTSIKSFGMLGTQLMIRAVKRSEQLYISMKARCYDDTIKVLRENKPVKPKVIFLIILFDTLLFIFAVWRKYFI